MDQRDKLGLPPRPFFYTIDQISTILNVEEEYLRRSILYYRNRTTGVKRTDEIECVNIATLRSAEPVWRIEEGELMRWMRYKKMKYSG